MTAKLVSIGYVSSIEVVAEAFFLAVKYLIRLTFLLNEIVYFPARSYSEKDTHIVEVGSYSLKSVP